MEAKEAAVVPADAFTELHPKLVVSTRPHSYEAEQFRVLRTSILFPKTGTRPRSILVTSTLPGEGKSFVSANLAASIAQHIDTRVLLIDCDLRKPNLHSYFGVTPNKGLTQVLQGKAAMPDVLMRTPIDRLMLLPAGHPPDNPSELLSSHKMREFLKEVTNRYSDRLVLIDSPPPKLTAETGALARLVDGILLVVRFQKANREMAGELVELVGKERIIGAVGNYLDLKALSYYGKSKYAGYGSYYGKKSR
ncbi:MAG: polysaccharide biosynthesis tyrosine autokinase [Desulfobacterales bacterium]